MERTQRSSPSDGHPATCRTTPSAPTSRLGSGCAASQPTAVSPRTIEAVLAMFASRQLPAQTLTVRHTLSAERPVTGSTRWCAVPEDVRQRRNRRARGGESTGAQRDPLAGSVDAGAVVIGHPDPPAVRRGRTSDRQVPTEGHKHATTGGRVRRRRRMVRGQSLGGRTEVENHAASDSNRAVVGIHGHRPPTRDRPEHPRQGASTIPSGPPPTQSRGRSRARSAPARRSGRRRHRSAARP